VVKHSARVTERDERMKSLYVTAAPDRRIFASAIDFDLDQIGAQIIQL
jgi:hypothetical protein